MLSAIMSMYFWTQDRDTKLECFQSDTTTTKSRKEATRATYICVLPCTYYSHYPGEMTETSWLYWINVPRLALPGKIDYRATLCQAWQQVGTSKEDICETLSSLALPINTTGRRRDLWEKQFARNTLPLTQTNVQTQQMGGKYLMVTWHPLVRNAFYFIENRNSKQFVRLALETNHASQ